jgi:hypothetical protein
MLKVICSCCLEPEVVDLVSIMSSFASGYLIITYTKLGSIHEASKAAIVNSWKRKYEMLKVSSVEMLEKRQIDLCRPLRLNPGAYGYYRKATSLPIVGKVLMHLVKVMMLVNKVV